MGQDEQDNKNQGRPGKELAEKIKEHGIKNLSELLDRLFDDADDVLFEMSDRASTNEESASHFDAMRQLRLQRPAITKGFHEALSEATRTGEIPDPVPADINEADFSLMPADLVEEEIACKNMANKASYRHRYHIAYVEDGLGQLAERARADVHKHAFSPRTLTGAFHYAMSRADIELETKLLIYKLFDRFVIEGLRVVYDPIVSFLEEAGIERTPLSRQSARPSRAQARPSSAPEFHQSAPIASASASAAGQGGSPWSHAPVNVDEHLDYEGVSTTVARWMARHTGSDPARGGVPWQEYPSATSGAGQGRSTGGRPGRAGHGRRSHGAQPAVPPPATSNDHLFDAVHAINHAHRAETLDMPGLLAMLYEAFAAMPTAAQRASAHQRRHLTRIARTFDIAMSDTALTEPARDLLARARGPLMMTALFDESFYDDPDHPSRNLLNELATVGTQLDSTEDPHYLEIRDLLDHMGEECENDPALVDLIYQRVCEIRATRTRKLGRQATVARVRRRAILEMSEQLQEKYLPEGAREFLRKGWGPLLCLMDLRHGPDSPEYRETLEQMNRIIDAVQPVGDANDREARQTEVEAVLELAEHGLRHMRVPDARRQGIIEGLREALDWASVTPMARASNDTLYDRAETWATRTLRRAASERASADDIGREGVATPEDPANDPEVEQETQSDKHRAPLPDEPIESLDPEIEAFLLAACQPMAWFKLDQGEGRSSRWLKVLSYERANRQVHFGNRRGDTVVVRDALTVAQGLQDGTIQPVHDIPGFERRLADIIASQAARLSDAV